MGEWGTGNGEWGTGNGEWGMGNGEGPDAFEAAVGEFGERGRKGGRDGVAGESAPDCNLDCGSCVHHVVPSVHEPLDLGPVGGVEFPCLDHVRGCVDGGCVAGTVVFDGLKVLRVVVVHRCHDERAGSIEGQGAV